MMSWLQTEKAYFLYRSVRLHFLSGYDLFKHKGRLRGKEKALERNDIKLVDAISDLVSSPRQFVELCASQFLYGNDDFLYTQKNIEENYNRYSKVKGSIDYYLEKDLGYIELQIAKAQCNLDDYLKQRVMSDILSHKIEMETIIILDRKIEVIDKISGFESGKYKVRMHKASMFVTKGILESKHSSQVDSFLKSI